MVKDVIFIIHWCNKWWIPCLSLWHNLFCDIHIENPNIQSVYFVETYHHRCRFPAAVRFHPSHGIRLRWWNCSPLQEPPPLWAAEWYLPTTPTMTGFRTSNQAEGTIYEWRGERCMHRRAHRDVIHIHAQQKGAASLSTSGTVRAQRRQSYEFMTKISKHSSPGVTIYFKHILLKS